MTISSSVTFILAIGAAYAVPAWGFGMHFFPYTFLIAFLLAWGISTRAIVLGTLFALGFEVMLGLSLGVIPIAFLGTALAYGMMRRLIAMRPLLESRWSWDGMGAMAASALILWLIMMTIAWIVLRGVYATGYSFSSFLHIFIDLRLLVVAFLECLAFLVLMALIYRRKDSLSLHL